MEIDSFLQDPPRPSNRFRTDVALRRSLERLLPPDVFAEASPELDEMGERAASGDLRALGAQAEANEPRHVPYDAWGRRIDRLDVDPAWTRLVEIALETGLVALPYEDHYGVHSRMVQGGLSNLFDPVTATALCPIGMTDAAARVLLTHDEELAKKYVPKLTARRGGWTSGQWMTEKEGGSDIGRTGTVARPVGDGTYTLHGTKWFTSATTADMTLALARPHGAEPGSRGLSLFLLELRNADGTWNGITVRRLKNKFGTRGLPTAELDLDGAIAVPVGGIGRGVAKIAIMLNITRLGAAGGALAGVGELLSLQRDYASRREVFGKLLRDQPMHRMWIARVAAEYEAMLALAFHAGTLVGQIEHGTGDAALTRLVTPLTKLACAREAVWAGSELVESFGGAGYLEDTGIPRIFRNLHVNCIWEGTTSVMAHDVLRALRGEGVAAAFLADAESHLRAYDHPLLADTTRRVQAAVDHLRPMLAEPEESSGRRLAWGMARTYQAALLCEAAGWELDKHGDARAATAANLFASDPLISESASTGAGSLADLAFPRRD
ncbi:MAG: acyl-CoA dehydrogenase family protein [Actinomycetota bacterium]|nr:acyl-CoA dehydrogenase family protein [Actinomycetota bacterium]